MIVRYQSDGSVVMITQNDHAKLAGYFAAHWGNPPFDRPRPFAPTVRAAHYHDSGWFRYETDPRFDQATSRTPTYQAVPNDTAQLASYQWAIDMLSDVDPYTGLLASKHRTGLWQQRYGVMKRPMPGPPRTLSAEVEDFITRNEARQNEVSKAFEPAELAMNYNLLQVWDLLSLYICSNETHQNHVIDPVPTSYEKANGGLAMHLTPAAGSIRLDPYPFDQMWLPANVVYRQLSRDDVSDRESLRAAYFRAQPHVASYTFVA
jgi:hypothetical protein